MSRALLLVLALVRAATAGELPDLRLDTATLAAGISYDLRFFVPEACELQASDLCVRGPGARKLLRFNVFAVNQGSADLVLGEATFENPQFVYSQCHQHFHFDSFARYELRPQAGGDPILGQKRSFCVEDTRADTAVTPRRYCCRDTDDCTLHGTQGIQVGWGDLYASNLPCQWIDVTDDVPPGAYELCVLLNVDRLLPDSNQDNDSACVPLTVDAPDAQAAPRVTVRAPRARPKRRAGRVLKVAWGRRVRGQLEFQEVWFSPDAGQTWSFLAGGPDQLPAKRRTYRWHVPPGTTTDQARVRVVVWSRSPSVTAGAGTFLRGAAESPTFRIVP